MAPMDKPNHSLVEQQVKDVIQDLFQAMVQVSTYDTAGKSSKEVVANELQTLSASLRNVHATATTSLSPNATPAQSLPNVPEPLIQYVENGRNPDIYTREFVELVRRMNQLARGKQHAFVDFRDVLAREMSAALPELRADIDKVVEATGGREPIRNVVADGAARGESSGDAAGSGSGGEGGGGVPGRGT